MRRICNAIGLTVLVILAFTLAPLITLIEQLKDRERLRVINRKRAAQGLPPFASLWDYYRSR